MKGVLKKEEEEGCNVFIVVWCVRRRKVYKKEVVERNEDSFSDVF